MSRRVPPAVEGELELLIRATAGGSATGQSSEGTTDGGAGRRPGLIHRSNVEV